MIHVCGEEFKTVDDAVEWLLKSERQEVSCGNFAMLMDADRFFTLIDKYFLFSVNGYFVHPNKEAPRKGRIYFGQPASHNYKHIEYLDFEFKFEEVAKTIRKGLGPDDVPIIKVAEYCGGSMYKVTEEMEEMVMRAFKGVR
jgi:hypothetical protein